MGKDAEGAEPLLALMLLSALSAIMKPSQHLHQGRAGRSIFSSLIGASHGSQNMCMHLSTHLHRTSMYCLEHRWRFFLRGKAKPIIRHENKRFFLHMEYYCSYTHCETQGNYTT